MASCSALIGSADAPLDQSSPPVRSFGFRGYLRASRLRWDLALIAQMYFWRNVEESSTPIDDRRFMTGSDCTLSGRGS